MDSATQITSDTRALRGRGALSNASGRYERETRVLVDDGWTKDDETPPPLKTEVLRDFDNTRLRAPQREMQFHRRRRDSRYRRVTG